jgi:hypothetical protein
MLDPRVHAEQKARRSLSGTTSSRPVHGSS